MKQTEAIDRLFLELSQFTSARTARELQLLDALKGMRSLWETIGGDEESPYAIAADRAARSG